jgi:hypothetical protein
MSFYTIKHRDGMAKPSLVDIPSKTSERNSKKKNKNKG